MSKFWKKDKNLQPDEILSRPEVQRHGGLQQLTPEESQIDHETSFDICFVHGLTGHLLSTWTSGKCLWPRDLLSQDEILCRARVLTFGYDADVMNFWKPASHNDLRKHARSLLTDLGNLRRDTRTVKRDLIFVAHSMGGLVVEQALLLSEVEDRHEMHDVCLYTIGIAFLGTPFRGSPSASWGDMANKILGTVRNTNRALIKDLKTESSKLDTLQEDFYRFAKRPHALNHADGAGKLIQIHSFYEEYPIKNIGKIVEYQSARMEGYPHDSIPGNHMEMTKFASAKDVGFTRVKYALKTFLEEHAGRPSGNLDATNPSSAHASSTKGSSGSEGAVWPSAEGSSATPVTRGQNSLRAEATTAVSAAPGVDSVPSVSSVPNTTSNNQQRRAHRYPVVSFESVSGGNINFGSQQITGNSLSFGAQRPS